MDDAYALGSEVGLDQSVSNRRSRREAFVVEEDFLMGDNNAKRGLTKEERENLRDGLKHEWLYAESAWKLMDHIEALLNELDAADEEITKWVDRAHDAAYEAYTRGEEIDRLNEEIRLGGVKLVYWYGEAQTNLYEIGRLNKEIREMRDLLRTIVSRVLDGDELPWDLLRERRTVDKYGDPIVDDERGDVD